MILTSNYGLRKPEGADLVNVEDFNTNADMLDEKLAAVEAEMADVKKSVSDGDTAENIITFESRDAAEANVWTDVDVLVSGEKHKSILKKVSMMFKNARYLYKMLGTTNISAIGGGTVTGAIASQNEALATVNTNLSKQYIQYGTATCKYYTNYFLQATINLPKKYRGTFVGFATKATNVSEASRHVSCLVDNKTNTISIFIENKDGGFTQSDTTKAFWMTVGVL